MVARKRISYAKFKQLWGRTYEREYKKNPFMMPADITALSLTKVSKKYRFRRVLKNPFYFHKPSNAWGEWR